MPVAVPPGERYSATLIDTWDTTRSTIADSVERGQLLHIEPKPFLALELRRIDQDRLRVLLLTG